MYILKNISFTWNQIVHYQLYMGTILYKMQLRVCLDAAQASHANRGRAKKLAQYSAAHNLPASWRKIELGRLRQPGRTNLLVINQTRAHAWSRQPPRSRSGSWSSRRASPRAHTFGRPTDDP